MAHVWEKAIQNHGDAQMHMYAHVSGGRVLRMIVVLRVPCMTMHVQIPLHIADHMRPLRHYTTCRACTILCNSVSLSDRLG